MRKTRPRAKVMNLNQGVPVVRILVHTVCGCQDLGVGVREERAEWMGVATPLYSRSPST